MKYLSLFSGIEAATAAWHSLGWEPVGFAEIEKFPAAVLNHHFPDVKNYGDVTKYKEWNIEPGAIDVIVGGSPCQAFSVAGLRGGLADPRGNLMLTYGAIAGHLRPRVIVWENVPGVLSSSGGGDFGTFLGMLAELGYGFAYRVLDAQYVRVQSHRRAVPQRRRRVFVVGYLGDWRRAAAILFESESLRGYSPPSRKAGERVAPSVTVGPPFSRTGNDRVEAEAIIPVSHPFDMEAFGQYGNGETSSTVKTRDYKDATDLIAFPERMSGTQVAKSKNVSPALMSRNPTAVISIDDCRPILKGENGRGWNDDGSAYTLDTKGYKGVCYNYKVRRLTPEECERLQGFPTGWTKIPWRGKSEEDCPDGPRYKAIGNSMAVNVMRWIGERIEKYGK